MHKKFRAKLYPDEYANASVLNDVRVHHLLPSEPQEVAIVGDHAEALLATTFAEYRPNLVVAMGGGRDTAVPLLQERKWLNDKATAYVCQRFVCQQPVNEPEALAAQLNS